MDTWHEGELKLKPHWVAVEGYFWMGTDYLYLIDVACTHLVEDRWLCWNALNALDLLGPWVIPVRDAD